MHLCISNCCCLFCLELAKCADRIFRDYKGASSGVRISFANSFVDSQLIISFTFNCLQLACNSFNTLTLNFFTSFDFANILLAVISIL